MDGSRNSDQSEDLSAPTLGGNKYVSSIERVSDQPGAVEESAPAQQKGLLRSRASVATTPAHEPSFGRTSLEITGKKLWNPADDYERYRVPSHHRICNKPWDKNVSPAISREQLIAEVRAIYAGLVMVESKCLEADDAQSEHNFATRYIEHWQVMSGSHDTLSHGHLPDMTIRNPELRHEINFDPDLHFRPNVDGEKGRRKQEKAAQFWRSIIISHEYFLLVSKHTDNEVRFKDGLIKILEDLREDKVAEKDKKELFDSLASLGIPSCQGRHLATFSPTITRRGRGTRRNDAYWKERNKDPNAGLFDERELLFSNKHGALKVSRLANLDTQLKIRNGGRDDLIMSSHCARELGVLDEISTDFEDPCLQSISGHSTAVKGVLRNVQFRLKGSSATFSRNFWVCDAIDGIVDVMIGASFIKDNFKMLFEKVKECASSFAAWFSKKKETPEQKREREEQERQQKIKINELEIKRLQRENEMHQRASERSSNSGGSVHQGST